MLSKSSKPSNLKLCFSQHCWYYSHCLQLHGPNIKIDTLDFFKIFYCSEVSNIHLVTRDYKIVPLTNLLMLLFAGRIMEGGWVGIVRLYGCSSKKKHIQRKQHCHRLVGVKGECA